MLFRSVSQSRYVPVMKSYYVIASSRGLISERKDIRFHRLVTDCPKGMVVDHINHNTLDNRKENLRVCTNQENCENRKGCNDTNVNSKHRNVYWRKTQKTWHVSLTKNGKKFYGGDFKLLSDAIESAKNLRNGHFSIKEF